MFNYMHVLNHLHNLLLTYFKGFVELKLCLSMIGINVQFEKYEGL